MIGSIKKIFVACIACTAVFFFMGFSCVCAEVNEGGYLKYQDTPAPTGSLLSTISYVITLLLTFAFVMFLAYFASRLLGKKLGASSDMMGRRILQIIPLGGIRSIQVVDIAGKIFVLGVTEHSITLLQEITDSNEISRLRKSSDDSDGSGTFERIYQEQVLSLQRLAQNFPNSFGRDSNSERNRDRDRERDREKR